MPVHLAEDPAADEGADDADDDVAHQPVTAPDDDRRQDAGYQADDDPGQDVHVRDSPVRGRDRRPGSVLLRPPSERCMSCAGGGPGPAGECLAYLPWSCISLSSRRSWSS